MKPEDAKDKHDPKPEKVTIHIDREIFKLKVDEMSAEDLRALPEPDIGADRDLYAEVPGDREDKLVEAGERVRLKNGQHFFTAPATISPGRAS